MRMLLMYGGGSDGPEGWPTPFSSVGDARTYMRRDPGRTGDDPWLDRDRLCEAASQRGDPVHLLAVSYGGIAALLAALDAPELFASVTLFEPSCPDLAREVESVRAFRRALEPVLSFDGDDAEFSRRFAEAMRRLDPDGVVAMPSVPRLRATPAPWTVRFPPDHLRVPTLVVTGGWSPYFDEIAAALVRRGASGLTLRGYGHWVPAHPDAAVEAVRFAQAAEASGWGRPARP